MASSSWVSLSLWSLRVLGVGIVGKEMNVEKGFVCFLLNWREGERVTKLVMEGNGARVVLK